MSDFLATSHSPISYVHFGRVKLPGHMDTYDAVAHKENGGQVGLSLMPGGGKYCNAVHGLSIEREEWDF